MGISLGKIGLYPPTTTLLVLLRLYNAFCHRETDKIFALCSNCIINHVMFTSKDYGILV